MQSLHLLVPCLPLSLGTLVATGRQCSRGEEKCPFLPSIPFVVGKMAYKTLPWGFPGGAVVKNLPANAGDTGSSPGLGRSHMPRSN